MRPMFPIFQAASLRGPTREATEQQIRQAIEMHLRGMREDGLPIPEPVSHVEYIDVPA